MHGTGICSNGVALALDQSAHSLIPHSCLLFHSIQMMVIHTVAGGELFVSIAG